MHIKVKHFIYRYGAYLKGICLKISSRYFSEPKVEPFEGYLSKWGAISGCKSAYLFAIA